ncbi:DinB family protein, partial [Niastella populi]
MKKQFKMLLGALLFFTSAGAQNTDALFLEAAITKLRHSKEYTLKIARLMPEEKFSFRPDATEMTFGDQLLHISANMGWLCSRYLNGSENPVSPTDKKAVKKDEIVQVVIKTYDYAISVLEKFNTAQLHDTVSFFAGPMKKLQIINLVNDHQTHHRGQLVVYL